MRRCMTFAFGLALMLGGCGDSGSMMPKPTSGPEPGPVCDPVAVGHDANNCGACGHGCLGGACQDGVCQPALVGSGIGDVAHGFTYSGSTLFWASGNTLYSTTLDHGDMTVLATDQTGMIDLVVDGAAIYWAAPSNYTNVIRKRALAAGGQVLDLTDAITSNDYSRLVGDGDNLYWTKNPVSGANASAIVRIPKSGGKPTPVVENRGFITKLAVEGASLYWAEATFTGRAVAKMPKIGGDVATLGEASEVFQVAIQGSTVYWAAADGDNTKLLKSEPGMNPVMVGRTSGGEQIRALVAQDMSLYYATEDTVLRLDTKQSTATVIAQNLRSPRGLHVTPQALYFIAGDSLFRLAR